MKSSVVLDVTYQGTLLCCMCSYVCYCTVCDILRLMMLILSALLPVFVAYWILKLNVCVFVLHQPGIVLCRLGFLFPVGVVVLQPTDDLFWLK